MVLAPSYLEEVRRVQKELAKVPAEGPPIVSLYLNTRWSDEQQRERVRLFVAGRAAALEADWRDAPHGASVVATLRDLVQRVNRDLVAQGEPEDVDADGIAIFASEGRGLLVTLRSRVPFPLELEVAERPRLLTLARALDEHGHTFVVLVDGRWMRIFEVALGAVVVEANLEQYLPDRVDVGDRGPWANRMPMRAGPAALARSGGMSQMRVQRHVRDHLEHNLRSGAELLARLVGTDPEARVVICGEPELRGFFRTVLPQGVRERIVHEQRMDSRTPRHLAIQRAVRVVADQFQAARNAEVDEAIGRALGGDLAVLGTEDTLLALMESRLHVLYIDAGYEFGLGWSCRRCDAFGTKARAGCPYCGSETTSVAFGQEAVRRALAQETRVVVVPEHARLRHFRGMAGTVRRGLRPTAPGIGYGTNEPLPPR
jgi:hypothetical protein